jgi:type II secretory pathway component GspD/PulD (secretin)
MSNLVSLEEKNVGSNQIQISVPTVDLRELSTTVKVMDGQMIIIGGLLQKTESVQDNQVPFLGHIPFLKYFFKSRNKQDARSELVILLQPLLVNR